MNQKEHTFTSFYSILVRLKSLTRDPELKHIPKFLFHTGSIKRKF